MIPIGWHKATIGDLCEFINGNGFKPVEWSDKGLPIIRIQNMNGSKDFNYYPGAVKKQWLVESGQLLFAWAGTKGVSFGPKIWSGPTGVLNQHIYKLDIKTDLDKRWLFMALVKVTERIESQAHGFKATLLHVQKSDITGQVLMVPPLPEQKRIADIISAWEEGINLTEQLLFNSKLRKKYFVEKLLSGKIRVSGFEEDWRFYKMGDCFSRVTKKNDEGNNNVVTISAQQGLIKQEDYFNKAVASETLDGYFLIRKGQFAYNKSYSNGYPMGAIKRLNKYDKGVVTTLYICFEINEDKGFSPEFFEHYFDAGLLNRGLTKVANEGGRAHGLLNVKPSDFFNLKIYIPDAVEQRKIAEIISVADQEIQLIKRQLDCLRQERKVLMHQLLAGKYRQARGT